MAEEKTCCMCSQEVTDEEMIAQLDELIGEYIKQPGGLIPALQTVQSRFGYLPESVLLKISRMFDKPYSEVAGVVGFYSFFSTVPRGKYTVRVCLGTACYVRGGKEVLSAMKKELGIDIGETTEDRLFSLDVGRCFGACGLAPVIMVNDDVHQRVNPSKIGEILKAYAVEEPQEEGVAV
ncbi:NADH-quinone oxidoreductase subunit NuoE family protein [Tichowtungia aerotolerans]|uniref:NAD(P)H-dependent oxidoreductase subunit E n=1 Tax=Tichowtungia aerotolerans TaxID=2697043 RepID=A0A6P1M7J8_9BACT|nr:NAD(P)H-dependent oxidoreductase subunit E [Tichowtungia aerotolerans]QHI70560.1 NAD(P)H-dependent oxidoreductase subunit E [Tichowtungia aerotolerans]